MQYNSFVGVLIFDLVEDLMLLLCFPCIVIVSGVVSSSSSSIDPPNRTRFPDGGFPEGGEMIPVVGLDEAGELP